MSASSSRKRQLRVRNNIKKKNKNQRSKISVFRSNKNIYVQLIDMSGKVLQSCSSLSIDEKDIKDASGIEIAKIVGKKFGKACVDSGIKEVVFDKGQYLYGGRVMALADSCREAGLKF
ncbi:MAG: ribosomal protein [Rickettsiaceae bacterium]|jgi:large subunit ribosomal protein L18|nr:ribosomal protein [Rickettsiaceae bacterium]